MSCGAGRMQAAESRTLPETLSPVCYWRLMAQQLKKLHCKVANIKF